MKSTVRTAASLAALARTGTLPAGRAPSTSGGGPQKDEKSGTVGVRLFREVGIGPPRTLGELTGAARRIRAERPGMYGIAVGGAYIYGALPFIRAHGGELATRNEDGALRAAVDSASARRGITACTGLFGDDNCQASKCAEKGGNDTVEAAFGAGQRHHVAAAPDLSVLHRTAVEVTGDDHSGLARREGHQLGLILLLEYTQVQVSGEPEDLPTKGVARAVHRPAPRAPLRHAPTGR